MARTLEDILNEMNGIPQTRVSDLYASQERMGIPLQIPPREALPQEVAPIRQPAPDTAYLQKIITEMVGQKLKPTMEDVSDSAFLSTAPKGSGYKKLRPEEVASERYKSEIAPYTTMVKGLSAAGQSPSAVREYQYYSGLTPEEQQKFMNIKRSTSSQYINAGGEFVDPVTGRTVTKTLPPQYQPQNVQDRANAQETGKTEAERQAGYAKAKTALAGFEMQSESINNAILEAETLISKGTASGWHSYLSGVPNSDAGALKNALETIKANIGFDKLQMMREASPTGGALGQVSDFENRLLQAINGSLDPKQEKQLSKHLADIKKFYPLVMKERREAFNHDYGKYGSAPAPNAPQVQQPPVPTITDVGGYGADGNLVPEVPQPKAQPNAPFDLNAFLKKKGL